MVKGGTFNFELCSKRMHESEWVVFSIADTEGNICGCRWRIDALPREIAYSLKALAEKLDPSLCKSAKETENVRQYRTKSGA